MARNSVCERGGDGELGTHARWVESGALILLATKLALGPRMGRHEINEHS